MKLALKYLILIYLWEFLKYMSECSWKNLINIAKISAYLMITFDGNFFE